MPVREFSGTAAALLLCILFLLDPGNLVFGQKKPKWRVKNRLQLSYEFDNNIRENPSDSLDRIEDSSARFLFSSKASRSGEKIALRFTYQGGLQTYFQHSIENKLINEIRAAAILNLQEFRVGLRGAGRLKIYLNDVLNYSTGSLESFVRPPPFWGFANEFSVRRAGIEYSDFPRFDYTEIRLGWTFSRTLSRRFGWETSLFVTGINYDREAISFDPENASLTIEPRKQNDDAIRLLTRFSYSKSFLFSFSYSLEYNDSNSYGYTFSKHQFVLVTGIPLPRGIWLRGYGALQFKNYSEETLPMFPTDLDTEREESNFFVLDLSKDLNRGTTALLRFAYYNNESVIRSRFYSKFLLTTGFDFRF